MTLAHPTPYESYCTHKWDFNQCGGGNIGDSKEGYTLVNVNAYPVGSSNGGCAYGFPESDSYYLATADVWTGVLNSYSGTLEIIVDCTVSAAGAVFSRLTSFLGTHWYWYGWFLALSNTTLDFQAFVDHQHTPSVNMTAWASGVMHFFISWNAGGGANNYRIYSSYNGNNVVLENYATWASNPLESQAINTFVGRRNDAGYPFGGYVWLIRTHNAQLTEAQMNQNVHAEGWRYGVYVVNNVPSPSCSTGVALPTLQHQISMPNPSASTGAVAPTSQHKITLPDPPGCVANRADMSPQIQIPMPQPHAVANVGDDLLTTFSLTLPDPPSCTASPAIPIPRNRVIMPVRGAVADALSPQPQIYIPMSVPSARAEVARIVAQHWIDMPFSGATADVDVPPETFVTIPMRVPSASAGPARVFAGSIPWWPYYAIMPSKQYYYTQRNVSIGSPTSFRMPANLTPEDAAKIGAYLKRIRTKVKEEDQEKES